MSKTILIVDDKTDIRMSLQFLLKRHHYQVVQASSPDNAMQVIQAQAIDLILLDMNYRFDTTSGEEGLSFLKHHAADSPPIIAMTAWSSINLAVEAMQLGAKDFIAKPWDNHGLLRIIKKHLALVDINQQLTSSTSVQKEDATTEFEQLLWHSNAMQLLKKKLERVINTSATLLLLGENGTGKSCIAKAIHQASRQANGPLVTVNMGAIPESLFESEMFGHIKGAFTDAKQDRIGRFEMAKGGTMFLDEVGTIALSQQTKLLRVLESGHYERVGDSKTLHTQCRLICASNAPFEKMLKEGTFRADLYYRLNTIELTVPSLKERIDDILPLANYFIGKHSKKYQLNHFTDEQPLSACAEQALQQYDWPGNVRELSHVMERAVLMCDEQITEVDLQLKSSPGEKMPMMTLEDAEKKLLKMALQQTDGNVDNSADLLGISSSSIYRRLDKYQIRNK